MAAQAVYSVRQSRRELAGAARAARLQSRNNRVSSVLMIIDQ